MSVVPARHWGTTPEERGLVLPCDGLVPGGEVLTRAVTVAAPAELVLRWLCQLQVAPYSYDLVDNPGRRSPQELTPGADRLRQGDRWMTVFALEAFEPDETSSWPAASCSTSRTSPSATPVAEPRGSCVPASCRRTALHRLRPGTTIRESTGRPRTRPRENTSTEALSTLTPTVTAHLSTTTGVLAHQHI